MRDFIDMEKLCREIRMVEERNQEREKKELEKQTANDLIEENRVLKKALEIAAEKIEFMAQMLGQTLDYDIKENLIRQAKESKDE